jgi:hypothetical protein
LSSVVSQHMSPTENNIEFFAAQWLDMGSTVTLVSQAVASRQRRSRASFVNFSPEENMGRNNPSHVSVC